MTTAWRTSSACNESGCIEVRPGTDGVEMRASHSPDGPILRFTADQWKAFLDEIRAGQFDDL